MSGGCEVGAVGGRLDSDGAALAPGSPDAARTRLGGLLGQPLLWSFSIRISALPRGGRGEAA